MFDQPENFGLILLLFICYKRICPNLIHLLRRTVKKKKSKRIDNIKLFLCCQCDCVVISVIVIMIILILIGTFIFFGVKQLVSSFCGEIVIKTNITFTNYENACNSPGGNESAITFFYSKDFWPWVHSLVPVIFHLMFSTFVFGYWKYKKVPTKRSGKRKPDGRFEYIEDKTEKWRTAFVPHLTSYCMTLTLCFVWEYIEQFFYIVSVDVFREMKGDSIGDMINPVINCFIINLLIAVGYVDPPAMILRFLSIIEIFESFFVFLLFALSSTISIFDFVTNDNSVIHAGFLVCPLVMILILLYWRELFRNFTRSVKIYDEWIMEMSWVKIFLYLIIMWVAMIQMIYYTYIKLVIGLTLYTLSCLLLINLG